MAAIRRICHSLLDDIFRTPYTATQNNHSAPLTTLTNALLTHTALAPTNTDIHARTHAYIEQTRDTRTRYDKTPLQILPEVHETRCRIFLACRQLQSTRDMPAAELQFTKRGMRNMHHSIKPSSCVPYLKNKSSDTAAASGTITTHIHTEHQKY